MTGPDQIWAWVSGQSAGLFDTSFHDNAANAIEYVRADLFEASAAMASRQNALIDTLRDELVKARSPFNPPKGQIDANLWFWRCRAEMLEEVSVKRLEEAKAMRDAAMKATRNAEREVEAMGRTISKLQEKLAAYEVKT